MTDQIQTNVSTAGEMMVTVAGGSMSEDTLAQVVSMLQMDGQLAGGGQTIIIRQEGVGDIPIQIRTSNGEHLVADADNQLLSLPDVGMSDNQQHSLILPQEQMIQGMVQNSNGTVMEGMVTMGAGGQVVQMSGEQAVEGVVSGGQMLEGMVDMGGDNQVVGGVVGLDGAARVMEGMVEMEGGGQVMDQMVEMEGGKYMIYSTETPQPKAPPELPSVYQIKVTTGITPRTSRLKRMYTPPNAVRISTVTGHQKYEPPKFYKCETCVINFVSKAAFEAHKECCPSKKKARGRGDRFTCVFCSENFTGKESLIEHVKICSKVKVPNASKAISSSSFKPSSITTKMSFKPSNRFKPQDTSQINNDFDDDLDDVKLIDSDEDSLDEKNIKYDDEEDFNDFIDDEDYEKNMQKKSQKHLGPLVVDGKYQCRDCDRTFGKEYQYSRHVGACTNAPLNASRIDTDAKPPPPEPPIMPRKRGRPRKNEVIAHRNASSYATQRLADSRGKVGITESHVKQNLQVTRLGQTSDNSRKLISSVNKEKNIKSKTEDDVKNAVANKMNSLLVELERKNKAPFDRNICGLCTEKCVNVVKLQQHMVNVHNEDLVSTYEALTGKTSQTNLRCPLCLSYFASSQLVLQHMVATHTAEIQAAHKDIMNNCLDLPCPWCNDICLKQSLLEEHIALKHGDHLKGICKQDKDSQLNGPSSEPTGALSGVVANREPNKNCPECGFFYRNNDFDAHVENGDCDRHRLRNFVCSEPECFDLTFYKLVHLLSHLRQVHDKHLPCEKKRFSSYSSFLSWLETEEARQKVFYDKAFQRLKKDYYTSTWICSQFHSSQRDSHLENQKENKNQHDMKTQLPPVCFARIHVDSYYSEDTGKYDGKTEVVYYSEHRHTEERQTIKDERRTPEKSNLKRKALENAEQLPALITRLDKTDLPAYPSDVKKEPLKEETTKHANSDDKLGQGDVTLVPAHLVDKKTAARSQSFIIDGEEFIAVAPGYLDKGKKRKAASTVDYDSDGDYSPVKPKPKARRVDRTGTAASKYDSDGDYSPTKTKPKARKVERSIKNSSVKRLNSSSARISSPKNSPTTKANSSIMKRTALGKTKTRGSISKTKVDKKENEEGDSAQSVSKKSKDKDSTRILSSSPAPDSEVESETTYILPADADEWNKMFELIQSQLDTNAFTGKEAAEAKALLQFEKKILSIPIEKQVEVFQRLCSLADIQVA